MNLTIHKKNKVTVLAALTIFVTIIPFFLLHYGINFTDEPYHLRNLHYYQDFPMTVLSYYIAHLLNYIANEKLINFRYITAALLEFNILLPVLFYYHKTKKATTAALIYIALIAITALKSSYVFGYDILSNTMIVISVVLYYEYSMTKRWKYMPIILGFTSALAIGCRIPNVVIVPFIIIGLLTDINEKQKSKVIVTYLAATVISLLCIYTALYGSVMGVYNEITNSSIGGNYTIKNLIAIYCDDLKKCSKISVYVIMLYILLRFVAEKFGKYRYLHAGVVVLCMHFFYRRIMPELDFYAFIISYLYATVWLLTAYFSFQSKDNRTMMERIWLIGTVALFTAIPISGSNTGILKIGALYTLPILLTVAIDYTKARKSFYFVSFVTITALLYNKLYRQTYEDAGIKECTTQTSSPILQGLRSTPDRAAAIERQNLIMQEAKGDIMVIGDFSIYYECAYDMYDKPMRGYFWRRYGDEFYVRDAIKEIKQMGYGIILVTALHRVGDYDGSPMQQELTGLGYKEVERGKDYAVLKK